MKIDNDFLTLLDLTVRIERVHQMTMVGRPVAEQMRLSEEIDRMNKDRDALVAKINAADDACLSQIEKAMGRPAGDDRDAIIAMLRGELKQSRATIDAITANLKKREASMVEAKDAAPAPSQPEYVHLTGLGETCTDRAWFSDPAQAMAKIAELNRPVAVRYVHSAKGPVVSLGWNVSPKDDGEGR